MAASLPPWPAGLLAVSLVSGACVASDATPRVARAGRGPFVRVFRLAGQSDMEGQSVVDLDDERDCNGGGARFVPTRAFLREPEASPHPGHGHHWFGNAESCLPIGDALGRAMVELLEERAVR